MSNVRTLPPGFIPQGTGAEGARFGREPASGLAYKADGSTRKARVTLDIAGRLAKLQEMAQAGQASIGRAILKASDGLASLRGAVGTFRKWVRDAKAYATPEACAERRAYHERMIASIDAKHEVASKWLPKSIAAVEAVDGLYAKMGTAYAEFQKANGRAPNAEETERIVATTVPANIRKTIEGASDPANDPFAQFRRDAAEPFSPEDAEDDDEDLNAE